MWERLREKNQLKKNQSWVIREEQKNLRMDLVARVYKAATEFLIN